VSFTEAPEDDHLTARKTCSSLPCRSGHISTPVGARPANQDRVACGSRNDSQVVAPSCRMQIERGRRHAEATLRRIDRARCLHCWQHLKPDVSEPHSSPALMKLLAVGMQVGRSMVETCARPAVTAATFFGFHPGRWFFAFSLK